MISRQVIVIALTGLFGGVDAALAEEFDIAINHGRVMDPETGCDWVGHVGIRGGTIAALSDVPLSAKTVVDARGMVVTPGFINLHWHGTDPKSNYYEAMDGVTATFELEIGVADVDLFVPDSQFVYGEADRESHSGVLSTFRLKNENDNIKRRLQIESVHQAGHLVGLSYCEDVRCVMFFATSLADCDRRNLALCNNCRNELNKLRR